MKMKDFHFFIYDEVQITKYILSTYTQRKNEQR